jgi:hypothetical protein
LVARAIRHNRISTIDGWATRQAFDGADGLDFDFSRRTASTMSNVRMGARVNFNQVGGKEDGDKMSLPRAAL